MRVSLDCINEDVLEAPAWISIEELVHLLSEELGELARADVDLAPATYPITHAHHALIRADYTGIFATLVAFVPLRIDDSTSAEEGEGWCFAFSLCLLSKSTPLPEA